MLGEINGRECPLSFVKAVDRSLKAPVSVSRVKADVLSGVYSLRKLALLRKKHGF